MPEPYNKTHAAVYALAWLHGEILRHRSLARPPEPPHRSVPLCALCHAIWVTEGQIPAVCRRCGRGLG
jgi:hypothetical protein